MIADPTEEFPAALLGELGDSGPVRTCREGRHVLELVGTFRPDALVLDLAMPGVDGLEMLEAISAMPWGPAILIVTRFVSDYVLDAITRMGVSYVMYKPCSTAAVARRLQDILERRKPLMLPADPRTVVTNLLLELGIPTKRRGYLCLREAIISYSQDPGQSITKELYPAVGAVLGGTGEQVEHQIRTAIGAAWEIRDTRLWSLYFPPTAPGEWTRPSNRAFISRMAEAIYMDTAVELRRQEPEEASR